MRWLRQAWQRVCQVCSTAISRVRKRTKSVWTGIKIAVAFGLSLLVVRTSSVLASGLIIVPWIKKIKGDYTKVFATFAFGIAAAFLLANGIIIIADLATIALMYSMYEMLTSWWDKILKREHQAAL